VGVAGPAEEAGAVAAEAVSPAAGEGQVVAEVANPAEEERGETPAAAGEGQVEADGRSEPIRILRTMGRPSANRGRLCRSFLSR
jgi:hypothetical protein